ncbi:MAG TPA: RimK family protein [Methylomirabilota bacterium]|nr:RimK family protein [Methylomirabilota bacterium]
MENLVVVTQAGDWPSDLPGARVVTARAYLTEREFGNLRNARVFNLCRHYRYQAFGYYVSLLAEARGHRPVPTVLTMQDLRTPAVTRVASGELEDRMKRSLKDISDGRFTLPVYFGRTPDGQHERLAADVFQLYPVPMLRAVFGRHDGDWELQRVTAVATSGVPEEDREFAFTAARAFFARRFRPARVAKPSRFDLVIVADPTDPTAPSDPKAIEKFVDAADRLDIAAEVLERDEVASRLLEFDAAFLRCTTAVEHWTYRTARRAAAEGMVVIDDPVSILRCTNKVYLAELLARHDVPAPRTVIVGKDHREQVAAGVGLPCIVKQPDSSSSLGVFKAETADELEALLDRLFSGSDLVIAQEFVPTEYDWRIGILDRRPLFAARYFMAPKHWQIIHHDAATNRGRYGKWQVVPVEEVPAAGVELALKAANLVGDGLYGVDLKLADGRWLVIEVNDNPNIEAGVEDLILKDEVYRRVMASFLRRLEAVTEGRPR